MPAPSARTARSSRRWRHRVVAVERARPDAAGQPCPPTLLHDLEQHGLLAAVGRRGARGVSIAEPARVRLHTALAPARALPRRPCARQTWPTSPAASRPIHALPSRMIPPPTPVPQKTPRTEAYGRAAPSSNSASVATCTSLPSESGAAKSVLEERAQMTPVPEAVETLSQAFQREGYATAASFRRGTSGATSAGAATTSSRRSATSARPRRRPISRSSGSPASTGRSSCGSTTGSPTCSTSRRRSSRSATTRATARPGAPRCSPRCRSSASCPATACIAWLGDARDPAWAPAMYAAEVHHTDAEVGRLLGAVAGKAGDRTAIVVTADHGESLGEHGIYYAHTGLYDPQLRVPLIVHWPGAPRGAERRAGVARSTSRRPSPSSPACALSSGALPGVSLAPTIRGQGGPEARRAARADPPERAQPGGRRARGRLEARSGRWAATIRSCPGSPSSSTSRSDPGELRDLAAAEPARVAALRASTRALDREGADPARERPAPRRRGGRPPARPRLSAGLRPEHRGPHERDRGGRRPPHRLREAPQGRARPATR